MISIPTTLVSIRSHIVFILDKKKWNKVEIKSSVSPKGVWGSSAVTHGNSMFLYGGMDAAGNYSNELYEFNFGIISSVFTT